MSRHFIAVVASILFGYTASLQADLVILQYHHVSDSTPASTSTTVGLFEGQLDMIDQLDLTVAPLQSGTRQALAGELDNDKAVAITFDDAYDSVYTTAAPLLEEKGFPFTVFVNTDAVGKRGYMTWEQLSEFAARDGITIANHSEDHQHLVKKPDESREAWEERITTSLDDAQTALKGKLGSAAPLFAYPYGEFSTELETYLAKREWYGYGQQSGSVGASSGATRLPRFPMADAYGQLENLKTKLTSRAMPVDGNALPDGIIVENPPTLTFSLPTSLSVERLTCFASGKGRISVTADESNIISVTAPSEFNSRRFRYNCTHPAPDGSFFWLSQQWLDLSQPED